MDSLIILIMGAIAALMGNWVYRKNREKKLEAEVVERRRNIALAKEVTKRAEKELEDAKLSYDDSLRDYNNKYRNDNEGE
jgi:prephenate dehydrogenase